MSKVVHKYTKPFFMKHSIIDYIIKTIFAAGQMNNDAEAVTAKNINIITLNARETIKNCTSF